MITLLDSFLKAGIFYKLDGKHSNMNFKDSSDLYKFSECFDLAETVSNSCSSKAEVVVSRHQKQTNGNQIRRIWTKLNSHGSLISKLTGRSRVYHLQNMANVPAATFQLDHRFRSLRISSSRETSEAHNGFSKSNRLYQTISTFPSTKVMPQQKHCIDCQRSNVNYRFSQLLLN